MSLWRNVSLGVCSAWAKRDAWGRSVCVGGGGISCRFEHGEPAPTPLFSDSREEMLISGVCLL